MRTATQVQMLINMRSLLQRAKEQLAAAQASGHDKSLIPHLCGRMYGLSDAVAELEKLERFEQERCEESADSKFYAVMAVAEHLGLECEDGEDGAIIVQEPSMEHCENCGKDYPLDQVEMVKMGEGEDDYACLCDTCRGIPQLTPVGADPIKPTDVF